jgi:hypothetical protein
MNLMDPDGMQPNNGTWHGVPLGDGSSGFPWGTAGAYGGAIVNGAFQFGAASSAFNINKPVTTQNWSGLNKAQGNQVQIYQADVPPPVYNSNDPWYKKLGYYAYDILDAALSPLNALSDNTPKDPIRRAEAIKESQRNVGKALVFYGGGELLGKSFTIFGDLAKPVVGHVAENIVFRGASRIEAGSLKEFKSLVNQLSQPGSELTKKELIQLKKLTAKFGGKLRYDLNPIKGKILKPHVQVEGLGSRVASRHIWLK